MIKCFIQYCRSWVVKQRRTPEVKILISPEEIASHDPTAVKRDPENIKQGIAESEEESKERLRRSGMTKGTDKA